MWAPVLRTRSVVSELDAVLAGLVVLQQINIAPASVPASTLSGGGSVASNSTSSRPTSRSEQSAALFSKLAGLTNYLRWKQTKL